MRKANKLMLAAVLAVALPTGALAAEVDLQVKIDKLTQQMEDLKGQVQRMEDKSLGKWLKIGGSYQFRVDSLRGETVGYTDAMGSFTNMANAMIGSVPAADQFGAYMALQQMQVDMMAATSLTGYSNFMTAYGATLGPLMVPANMETVLSYKPKNETLYTNKFNLDLKAQATKDVTVNVKLGMYKVFGSQNDDAITSNAFFADRTGVFDGTLGHTPSDSKLNVDRAYATWSNILEQPLWFSVGRRPATDGAPLNLKLNTDRPGNGGTPALLVNYAFDGMTVGYAPDIDALPGFYAKVCYGRGFDSGFKVSSNSLKDTDMLGVAVIPVDTDPLRVWLQWNRGFNIFDFPVMENTAFGNTAPSTNLGSIDWYGIGAMSTLKKVGPGNLNFFVDGGLSRTNPNNNVSGQAMFQGLLTGSPFQPDFNPDSKTGYAVYAGVRYDLPSKTKLGFEYNYGSKNWIPFSPAADDMWTSKVGTRGHVFEPYIIQELDLKPVSSYFAKAFFRLGYQYYDFNYTGSNNWVGAPIDVDDLAAFQAVGGMLLQTPVKKAQNIYGTFEVQF